MKKLLFVVCCFLFLCFQVKKNGVVHLDYFVGKWEIKKWNGADTKQKPDIVATWFMDKDPDVTGNYKGYVQLGNNVHTSETISWNEKEEIYTRIISVSTGTKINLKTIGWVNDKLTWAGTQSDGSNNTGLKEEIVIKDSDNFKAVFYEEQAGKWILTQTELLTRIN